MQTAQTTDADDDCFVFVSNKPPVPGPSLALLVGKEVLIECLDNYGRHANWNFTVEDTQRFIEIATDPSLRRNLQPELVREVDKILRDVIAPMGYCGTCRS